MNTNNTSVGRKVLSLAFFGVFITVQLGAFVPPVQAAPQGTLIAQCLGNAVYLEWGDNYAANTNDLQRAEVYSGSSNYGWSSLGTNANMSQRSFVDYAVVPGTTYMYRVNYRSDLPSNVVTVSCGGYQTPYPTYYPYPTYPGTGLYCVADRTSVQSGSSVTFTAGFASGTQSYYAPFTWQAVGSIPSYATGVQFTTSFNASSMNEVREVTVSNGVQTARCSVSVIGYTYPTPYPTYYPTYTPYPTPYPTYYPYPSPIPPYNTLQCSANVSGVQSGQEVSFTATGGFNNVYAWSANGGTPVVGYGSPFTTRFTNSSGYPITRTVSVTSGGRTASCSVQVNSQVYTYPTYQPYPTYYPYPTSYPFATVGIEYSARNITRGGQGATVSVAHGDRIQFSTRITTGNAPVQNARIRQQLPAGMAYVLGTTNMDGVNYPNGIATGGVFLGTLQANRTYVVTSEAVANAAVPQHATSSIEVGGEAIATQTQTVGLTASSYYAPQYPRYTPVVSSNAQISATLMGRNVTRGQSGEYASVRAGDNDTIDVVARVSPLTGSSLANTYALATLPAGFVYVPGSTTVQGVVVADGIATTGINLGTVAFGTSTVVKFSVRAPQTGMVVLTGATVGLQVRADNAGSMAVQLPVNIGPWYALASASQVKTGVADSALIALLASLVVTMLYSMYAYSAGYARKMNNQELKRLMRKQTLNFSR